MRILMGGDTFAPDVNGAASFTVRLATGLAARGHDVHILAASHDGRMGAFKEEHLGQTLTVHRMHSFRWPLHDWLRAPWPWMVQHHVRRIMDANTFDVTHMQSHMNIGRGLAKQSKKRGIRMIVTNHFMPENLIEHTPFPKFTWPVVIKLAWKDVERLYSIASAITTPTKRAAEYLESKTRIRGVHAVSCGIRMSDYTPDFEPKAENRIAFTGRITGEKLLHELIEGVAKLPPELNAQLDLIGDGDLKAELERHAQKLGVADQVHFPGRVSDEELRRLLTRAKLFAITSTAELQSIATMEGMASGLPVVAADAMALPHLVKDGENGFLFPPHDTDALADRLERVLRLSQEDYEVMQRASLRVLEPHDIDTTVTLFERLYRGETITDPVTDVPPLTAKVRAQLRGLARRARGVVTTE